MLSINREFQYINRLSTYIYDSFLDMKCLYRDTTSPNRENAYLER